MGGCPNWHPHGWVSQLAPSQLAPLVASRSGCMHDARAGDHEGRPYGPSVTAPSLAELTSRAYFASTPLRA